MQYKTIIHELLQQYPEIHEQLRKERKLLPTMEHYARELKSSHQAWTQMLLQMRPDSDPIQIASEAAELAIKEMEGHLPIALAPEQNERQFLDAAMMFQRRRT